MYNNAKHSEIACRSTLSKAPLSMAVIAALAIAPASLAAPGEFLSDIPIFVNGRDAISEVAMDDDGDFVVAWRETGNVYSKYGYSHFALYDKLGAPQASGRVSPSKNVACQSVAMDADGDFVVAWTDYDYGGGPYAFQTFFQLYKSTGDPASPPRLAQNFFFGCPKVAMDDDGDFVIAMSAYAGYGYSGLTGLFAQTFDRSGFAITEMGQIRPTSGDVKNFPFGNHAVAMDADGDFVIAFVQENSSYTYNYDFPYIDRGLNYVRLSLDGRPGDHAHFPGSSAYVAPDVAMDDDGDIVVVARDSNNIDAFVYDGAGNPVASVPSIVKMNVSPATVPASVSMDADGDFNIAALQGGGNRSYMYVDRFNIKGIPLSEASVTKSQFVGHGSPSIAMDADGDFVATAFDYDYAQVIATRFDGPDPVVNLVLGALAPSSVEPGVTMIYNTTIANNSPDISSDAAEGVKMKFTQSGNLVTFNSFAGIGWNCPTPPVTAASFTCTYSPPMVPGAYTSLAATATAPAAGSVTMVIDALSNSVDEFPLNNRKTITTTVETSDLDLSLAFSDGVVEAYTGNALTYAATVTNNSASRSATGVQINMPIETGLEYTAFTDAGTNWACAASGTGVAGDTVTCTYGTLGFGQVTDALGIVMNAVSTATVSSTATLDLIEGDVDGSNNSVTDVTNIIDEVVDLALALDDGQTTADNSSELTYTATVSNSSSNNISATGVTLSVTLDPGLTYVSTAGTDPGWTCSEAAKVVTCGYASPLTTAAAAPPVKIIATGTPIPTGTVTTNGSVTSVELEENSSDNSDSDTTTIQQGTVDLAINSNSPTAVTVSGTVSHILSVTNHSVSTTATGISIQTVLDSNLTYVSASGADWTCSEAAKIVSCDYNLALVATASTPDVTISATVPGATGSLSTTSTAASSDQLEVNLSDNAVTDTTAIVTAFVDLSLSLTDGLTQAFTGDTLTYSATVTNTDASAVNATNAAVTVTLPAGASFVVDTYNDDWNCVGLNTITCNYSGTGIVSSGGASTFTMDVIAPPTASLITTSAVVSSSQNDLSAADNIAVDNDTNIIEDKVDLRVLFSDGLAVAQPDDSMMYVASVTNNDVNGINATNITLVVDLDDSLAFQSVSSFDFTACDAVADTNNVVTCTYSAGNLAQGQTISAYFFVKAPATATALSSKATATEAPKGDINDLNNTDIVDTTSVINSVVNLVLDMTGSTTAVAVGERETYTATVTNNIDLGDDATGVTIAFNLSDELTFIYEGDYGDWTCGEQPISGIVTCTYGMPLAPSEVTSAIEIKAEISANPGLITTSALASASLPDTDETDNSVSIGNEIVDTQLDLEIDLADGTDFVAINQPMTYVATVTNKFDSLFAATGVRVLFDLDPGLTYVSGSGTDWTCEVKVGQGLQCNYGSYENPLTISPGASSSVIIEVISPSTEGKISSSAEVLTALKDKNTSNDVGTEGTVITVASTGSGSLGWLTGLFMMLAMCSLRQCRYQLYTRK